MKKITYMIILILIILNSVLAYKFKSNSIEFNTIYTLLNKKLEKNKSEVLTYEHNFIKEKENDYLKLDSNLELINVEGRTVLAKDVLKTNSLIFRFSELNCEECIDAEIDVLLGNQDKFKKDVILIAYYQNQRDLFVFYKEFQKKGLTNIKMFLSPEKGLDIPIDKINMPFYFCVNSNLIMNNFFIPQKEKPIFSQVYLDYTSKNFLN